MAWMRSIAAGAIGVSVVLLGVLLAAPPEEKFHTRLAPVSMDASMRANVAGVGSATAVLTGSKLSVTGTFEALRSPATVAHLHQSRVAGVRGPAVFDLTVSHATSGTLSGLFDLSPEQVESVRKGRFYIQIQSEKAPDGNLWGWLMH
jgi:CHRD domain